MRALPCALLLAAGCVAASPQTRPGSAPAGARATFAFGHLTRVEIAMPSGYALEIRPVGRALSVGSHPVVRPTRTHPNVEGVTVEWPADPREVWVGVTGTLTITRFEGRQTGVPGEWIGDLVGHLLARIVRRDDPPGTEVPRNLDLDFAGGIYNAGESTSGY